MGSRVAQKFLYRHSFPAYPQGARPGECLHKTIHAGMFSFKYAAFYLNGQKPVSLPDNKIDLFLMIPPVKNFDSSAE